SNASLTAFLIAPANPDIGPGRIVGFANECRPVSDASHGNGKHGRPARPDLAPDCITITFG
ncbi:hypothetical protein, partial [Pannonibacter sp. SL95]|uniref:hypothetical protein n=1 Tax=Pannonibacter sp. SL95 TaxID=2995153 RepID=UPI002275D45C